MGGKAMETEKIKGPHRPTFHTYDTFTKKDEREKKKCGHGTVFSQ